MAKENFNLEWDNHNQLIASTFKRLYEDETLTDVTVYCKDGPLRAHKLVLSICSPYFNRIYQMNPGIHMVVMVNGVTMKEMQLLLEFMYKGVVTIPTDCYERLAQIAEQLEMTTFKNMEESEDKKNFFHSLNMKTLNEEKKQVKPKIDVNKIVSEYPDISMKGLVKNDKCQTEPQDEDTQQEDNESEESQEEESNTTNILCKTCNETFSNQKDLTAHLKTHKKGAKKPYSCELCCASFKRSSHLTRHKLIHTGEKPYSCSKCDKSFSRLDKLKQHTRNTHNSNSVVLTLDDLKKKRPLATVAIEEDSSSKKRHKGRPRRFPEKDEVDVKVEPDYDITNLPYGDLSYLTMPEGTNPMEPLVEIETSEAAGGVKLKKTPAVEIKAIGSVRKIGECIVSVTNNN